MAINSSHSIGQYCQWAILPDESLTEQATGTAPGGTLGSTITLTQGKAYVPGSTSTTWATPSAAINPYVNDITIAWYGRVDASVGAQLLEFLNSTNGIGWEFRSFFWDGNTVQFALYRAFAGNSNGSFLSLSGDDTVKHIVIRINKSAGTLDWFVNGAAVRTGDAWTADPYTFGDGSVRMSNTSGATNACITAQVYNVALSDSDIASLASDPKQIFAAPPKDLTVSSLTQNNTASTGEIGIAGILYASALTQSNSVSPAQIARVQDLTVSSLTQANSLPTVSVNPYNRLRTILRDLPVNTWVQVNTSQYIDCQMPLADRPPGFTNDWDHVKIVIPWSSIAFDHQRGHLLLWGGGHANYTGNQLYQWHADTGEWSLSCLPSRLTSDGNSYVVDKLAPQSSHTYQNNFWLQANDMFGTFGGAATPSGGPPLEDNAGNARRVAPWLYDLRKTDPNKVGGSDGSGWDTSRLGQNAWYPRRDYVPTGSSGTDTYPIDYLNHTSQAAVSISKDGKDYAIFTMDGTSGFPNWYRYEFGDVRAGENDTVKFLGGSGDVIVKEGWMVYDSKRELVYRNGYNKNLSYTQAELVARSPWTAGGPLTAIRLVRSSDGTTFTQNPISDDCPYGAVYDSRNDCIWLWGGTAPDTGEVYRINIPAYDSITGWASTTWTVDTIVPAGSRPNGLYQQPILGKIKHVPEIDAFIILDRAGAGGDPDPGVWAFKTAQIQGDLTAANLDQGNSAATGSITVEHTLSAGSTAQTNTATTGGITQTHALAIENAAQTNAASTGAISPAGVNDLVASSATQSNTVSTGAIVVDGVLVAAPSVQDNIAAASAIVQTHILAASSVTQSNSAKSVAISAGDGFLVSVVERKATFRRSKSVTVRFN